jgi:hypothetical protein
MPKFTGTTIDLAALSPEQLARVEYARQQIGFGRVFDHYGLDWKGDHTHQLSCVFHAKFKDAKGRPVERNPSVRYYAPDKRIYCFACAEGGDVVWFLGRKEGLPFGEALRTFYRTFGLAEGAIDATVLTRQAEWKKADDDMPVRRALLATRADHINDILWVLTCRYPQCRDALDRVAEHLFERLFSTDMIRSKDIAVQVLEWWRWANDLVLATIEAHLNERDQNGNRNGT